MDSPKDTLQHELDSLKQTRDELRVKLHLGSQDAKDAWDKLERKWLELEDNSKVGDAAKVLVSEIREGYQRFVTTFG